MTRSSSRVPSGSFAAPARSGRTAVMRLRGRVALTTSANDGHWTDEVGQPARARPSRSAVTAAAVIL